MSRNKIPKTITIQREKDVWDYRLKGWTYERIAEKIGISTHGVCKILKRLHDRYRKQHLEEIEQIKSEQISQLEDMFFESREAWERSKLRDKIERIKRAVKINEKDKSIAAVSDIGDLNIEQRDQDGDPRYLEQCRKCLEDIRKIAGADAPIKSESKVKFEGDLAKMSDDELIQEALATVNAATTQTLDGDNTGEEENQE